MRARKNIPTDHLESPNVISNGEVNLVNGYMTVAQTVPNNLPEAPTDSNYYARKNGKWVMLNVVTIQVTINGATKNLDVFAKGNPY